MGGFEFLIRLTASAAVFLFGVVVWAIVPLVNPDLPIELNVMTSVFFGNADPLSPSRELLLLSRFFFALGVMLFILVPTLAFFVDFPRSAMWNRTIAEVMAGLMVLSYLGAIVAHFFVAL